MFPGLGLLLLLASVGLTACVQEESVWRIRTIGWVSGGRTLAAAVPLLIGLLTSTASFPVGLGVHRTWLGSTIDPKFADARLATFLVFIFSAVAKSLFLPVRHRGNLD